MSAEILREAARLMRERHGAIGGSGARWRVTEATGHNRDSRRTLGTFALIHDDVSEVAIVRGFNDDRDPISTHIAAADPTFLLAAAALLEVTAIHHGPHIECSNEGCRRRGLSGMHCRDEDCGPHEDCEQYGAALAVARAYLNTT